MASLTAFRQGLQDALQTSFGFRFVAGDFPGPSTERDLGCVWVRGKSEWADDVNVEEIHMGVRVFKRWEQPEGTTLPNEDDLERLLELVQTTLKPLNTTLGPWFFRTTDLQIVRDQSAVETTLVAWQSNLGA